MRFLLALILGFFLTSPLLAEEATYHLAGTTLRNLKLTPNPPEVGELAVSFRLNDATGKPLAGAAVEVETFMPEMGAMPRMSSRAAAKHLGEGRYEAQLEPAMAGTWELALRITPPGGSKVEFPFSITLGIPGWVYKGAGANAPAAPPGATGGNLFLSRPRQQMIGVELGPVVKRNINRSLRTVAKLELDETAVFDLQLKYAGDLETLYNNREGDFVRQGQALFTIYSPELFEAQSIFLQLHREPHKTPSDQALYRRAREKLRLWSFSEAEINHLAQLAKPPRVQQVLSPVSGFIMKKFKVEGANLRKGEVIFRLADLSRLWAMAEIFEHEAGAVKVGDPAIVELAYQPGTRIKGKVDSIYPFLDEQTRTLKLRIKLENPQLLIRPGMFADVEIQSPQGEMLVVPRRAVLFSGQHKYVFLSQGEGYFTPLEVETGMTEGDWVQILAGLSEGQQITYSANFLISSEAQLRDALPRFGQPQAAPPQAKPQAAPAHQHGGAL